MKLKKWSWSWIKPSTLLLNGALVSCVSAPNINICKEKSPTRARCTETITGNAKEINDEVKLHGKTWWESRVTNVQVPMEDYQQLKVFILKLCDKYPDACKINNAEKIVDTIDNTFKQEQ